MNNHFRVLPTIKRGQVLAIIMYSVTCFLWHHGSRITQKTMYISNTNLMPCFSSETWTTTPIAGNVKKITHFCHTFPATCSKTENTDVADFGVFPIYHKDHFLCNCFLVTTKNCISQHTTAPTQTYPIQDWFISYQNTFSSCRISAILKTLLWLSKSRNCLYAFISRLDILLNCIQC